MIPGAEIADVLRQAIRGEFPVTMISPDTWQNSSGDIPFLMNGWRIEIFADVGEVDYVATAIAPDGRTGEYEDWCTTWDDNDEVLVSLTEPINELALTNESDALQALFLTLPPDLLAQAKDIIRCVAHGSSLRPDAPDWLFPAACAWLKRAAEQKNGEQS